MNVDRARWAQLKPLLEHALDLPDHQRAAYAASSAVPDAARDDLLSMLRAHDATETGADPLQAVRADTLTRVFAHIDIDESTRVGQTIGPYLLVRLLGTGGMGAVYLARRQDGGFTHEVALKIMDGPRLSRSGRDRFERERQILARLRHPNIALLFDGGDTPDGLAYYTMEYVDGPNLAEYCLERVQRVDDRVRLLIDAALALGHAHKHLVVHRDIKPSNILVNAEGVVKLVDFGIAKPMDDVEAAMTQRGQSPMTREYAAPEQFHGEPVTVATDVFQFGTLCYHLLSGHLPYRADPLNPYQWSRAVSEDAPLPLAIAASRSDRSDVWLVGSRVRQQLAPDLNAVVCKAIAKNPKDRYSSMGELAQDLSAYLDGRPVTARRAGTLYYLSRFLARRPYVSAGALVAVCALTVTSLIALRQADVATRAANAAESQARRADSINDFLLGLFDVSDPDVNRGEHLTAHQILDRGAAQIAHDFADQPAQRATLQIEIGEIYSKLGEWDKARQTLRDAAATLADAPDDAHAGDRARALDLLAWIAFRKSEFKDALALLEQARPLQKTDTRSALDEFAAWYSQHATAQRALGALGEAERDLKTALALLDNHALSGASVAANIRNQLGLVLRDEGDHTAAMAQFEQARAIDVALYGEADARVAGVEQNIANLLAARGDFDAAYARLQNAASIQMKSYGADNPNWAGTQQSLADIELKRRNYAAARTFAMAAENVYRRSLGEDSLKLAGPALALAQVDLNEGRAVSALDRVDTILSLQRRHLPPDHPQIALSLALRARILLQMQRYADARAAAAAAVDIDRVRSLAEPLAVNLTCRVLAEQALHEADDDTATWAEIDTLLSSPSWHNPTLAANLLAARRGSDPAASALALPLL